MTIFLFAGHGGTDPGAVGVDGRREADETIRLRDRVKAYLPPSSSVSIDNNADPLREVLRKAQTGNGSVVLDLHFNAASSTASGCEVLIGDDAEQNDIDLATDILAALVKNLGIKNRGIKKESETPRKRLGVMRESGAVCLAEVCFISNKNDMAAYDKAFDSLARDIATVLVKHDAKVT